MSAQFQVSSPGRLGSELRGVERVERLNVPGRIVRYRILFCRRIR